ncbi:MAG: ATP-dependent helicase [Candidatus Hydrogenedentes bacterium]|nr:ATP-dependent helicase [Candidatus Hydrogenedentota bacterium]
MVKLDNSQRDFCNSTADKIRLLAPAGSGKTLSLLWRCRAIQDANPKKPQRFLVVTFTRSARDELKARISTDPQLAELQSHIQVTTLNAFGFRYLRGQQTGLKVISKKDAYTVLNNVLRPVWSENAVMASVLSSGNNLNAYKSEILDAFDVLKGLGFRHTGNGVFQDFAKHLGWLLDVGLERYLANAYFARLEKMKLFDIEQKAAFVEFWVAATDRLNQSNYVTFADQKYFAMLKLEHTAIASNQRFHHILVDEFQDVDPLDMNLVRVLVKLHKSTLTIVGDDDQAIFEWRGAVPKFILEPERFFGGKFETHILAQNYRSPANIVRHSLNLIEHNVVRVKKKVRATSSALAEIVYKQFPSYKECCKFVMGLAREMNADSEGRRLAIVGRKRAQIIPFQILLASEKIAFYAKDDLNIFLQESFDSLRDTLLTVARSGESRRRTPELIDDFMKLVNKIKRYPLSKNDSNGLRTYLNNKRPRSFAEVLDTFLTYDGTIKGGVDALSFYSPISQLLQTETVADTLAVIGEEFKGFAKDYGKAQSLEDVFYVDPPFLHLADYAQRYGNDYDRFLDDLEEAIANLQSDTPSDDDENRDADELRPIHLMTALRAKGKEYHTVVVLDAIDGIWPSRLATTPAELEQERRLFYVAVTRPRERLFIVANRTVLGEKTTPSPYLSEMGLQ